MARLVGAIITWAAACLGLVAGTASRALAQELPTLAVVFDNSGSMWGKLEADKATKLVQGRDAVLAGLALLDGKAKTGLVTFGRRRGDCADVEVVAKPDAGEPERIKEALDRLNPKGRGPVVLATREAAKAIGATRPASIVLIHDDLDNCQQDACAAGAEIRREHPGLRVNVVSLGLKKEDLPRIACLAEATGGQHFDAQNAAQTSAFIAQAMAMTGSAPAPRPATAPQVPVPVPAARPPLAIAPSSRELPSRLPTPVPGEGPPALWLSAVLVQGGPLAPEPVSWRVLRKEAAGEVQVLETRGSEARAPLAPGAYTIEARYGLVRTRRAVEVAAGRPTAGSLVLEAGGVRFTGRAQSGGPPIDQVTYALFADGGTPAPEPLWIGTDPAAPIGVPPGSYRVTAERGLARSEARVTVAAGAIADADIALGAGLLTLRIAAREDGEALPGAIFIVAADDPGLMQGRRELVRSAATQPDFVLPAGSYTITTRIGDSEARDRIALGAGESVRRTIVLGLGRLAVSARVEQGPGQTPLREPISFRVLRKDAETREIARGGTTPYAFELPAGSYRVEAMVGSHNARIARDVELQIGRTTQLAVDIPAARLTLKLAADMGRGEPSWEVRDEADRVVARSNQPEPQLVLAPGRYAIRATVRDRQGEDEVTLRIGESRTIEIERD